MWRVYRPRTERLEKLLVPYAANIHDELGLELALRLLIDSDTRLTILRVAPVGQTPGELSNEFITMMEQCPPAWAIALTSRLSSIRANSGCGRASAAVDLTILAPAALGESSVKPGAIHRSTSHSVPLFSPDYSPLQSSYFSPRLSAFRYNTAKRSLQTSLELGRAVILTSSLWPFMGGDRFGSAFV